MEKVYVVWFTTHPWPQLFHGWPKTPTGADKEFSNIKVAIPVEPEYSHWPLDILKEMYKPE